MATGQKITNWLDSALVWSWQRRLAALVCGLAAVGLLAWAARLWPEWRTNPDLSHGFFALPVVWLLWRRAAEGAALARGLGPGAQVALLAPAAAALLTAAPLATVYAVAMGWSSVPTLFLLSVAAGAATILAGALAAGREVRWIKLGWPALVLPAVILLSAPLPPATYARLTSGLQAFVTAGVVETLRLFGVPAMRIGSVIHLGMTSVGVEDACSGVRSLISCVLAGLVLSALMLRSPARRAVLVLVAGPLALLTNFFRSLALTLLARQGVDIAGPWHDGLGFAVLGVTTALLAWLATVLETGDRAPAAQGEAAQVVERRGGALWAGLGAAAVLLLAAIWLGYVAARTEQRVADPGPVPDLARIIPAEPEGGWSVRTRTDLSYYSGALQTDHLFERVYQRQGRDGLVQITVYTAWWPAGGASVSTVAAHTPESCWPGAGWAMDDTQSARRALPLPDGREAREAEQRVFQQGQYPQRVWFWHLVGGAPFRAFNPHSWRDQLAVFFKQGVRRDQPQAFVRISTNRTWEEIAGEPLVREVLRGFAELGVPVATGSAGGEENASR